MSERIIPPLTPEEISTLRETIFAVVKPATVDELSDLIAHLGVELARKAVELKAIDNIKSVTIREIFPDLDLGASAPEWTQSYTATGWAKVYSTQLPNTKFLGIAAVKIATPSSPICTAIKYNTGASGAERTKVMYQIERALTEPNALLVFTTAVRYYRNDWIHIYHYAPRTGDDKIIHIGCTVEKLGETFIANLVG